MKVVVHQRYEQVGEISASNVGLNLNKKNIVNQLLLPGRIVTKSGLSLD